VHPKSFQGFFNRASASNRIAFQQDAEPIVRRPLVKLRRARKLAQNLAALRKLACDRCGSRLRIIAAIIRRLEGPFSAICNVNDVAVAWVANQEV
jgi:hypothetical protein